VRHGLLSLSLSERRSIYTFQSLSHATELKIFLGEMVFSLMFAFRPTDLEVGRPRTKAGDRGNFGRRNCSKDPMISPYSNNKVCEKKTK
jgi:hypothetical protein